MSGNDKRDNLELVNKANSKHSDYVTNANQFEGQVLKRHLENMCQTYGSRYTTEVILKVLAEEIKAIKQSKKAQKAG